MAEYILRNSLNPNKVVGCVITFRQLINKGDEGEPIWVVEITTIEPHKNGGNILPEYINYTSLTNLDVAIKEATEKIAEQINWEPVVEDLRPPFVISNFPENGQQQVGIDSILIVDIKDIFPAAGIDINSAQVTINGMDISHEIKFSGDPFNYKISWKPSIVVYDTE